MILDGIIAFFVGLLSALFSPIAALLNLVIRLVESIIGLFTDGINLGRIGLKNKEESLGQKCLGWASLLAFLGVLFWLFSWPVVSTREVNFIASDGYRATLASITVEKGDEREWLLTDTEGKVQISRFGVTALVVKDPRYAEKRWLNSEIKDEIFIERTVFGLRSRFLKGNAPKARMRL
ncbi:hypothetical protein OAF06_02730 [Akkermansiaceae bacterium]|nr:hypothetical protein [Akkermansiaceae bacterium]MDB4667673.1 hypothetical protein [Akkermansiaceae bacterium]